MSSFIIQLLIISVVGLMVQSAPVRVTDDHLQKRQAHGNNQKALEQKLYCAVTKVRNTANDLNKKVTLNVSAKYVGATRESNTDDNLTKYCMHFIMAMSMKHHLQDHLLDTDVTSQRTTASIENLSVLLTNLQTMANTLDDLQVNKHDSSCARFEPSDFKTIYKYIPYTHASLLQAIHDIADFWYRDEDSYEYNEARHCNT